MTHRLLKIVCTVLVLTVYGQSAGCQSPDAPAPAPAPAHVGPRTGFQLSPQGGTVTSVTPSTNGGLVGGGTSGALTLGLLASCSTGQALLYTTGTGWACGAVSSITGLTTGAIAVATSATTIGNYAGSTTCAAGTGAVALTSSGVLTCVADVTSVVAGTGISSSTVSGAATITANLVGASCAAGTAVTSLSATGTGTCTAVGSTTGTGTTNTLSKWTSAGVLGSSSLADDGAGTVTIPGHVVIGDITHGVTIGSPLQQALVVSAGAQPGTNGEINLMTLTGAGHLTTTSDVFAYVVRNHVTFDTTAGTNLSGGYFAAVDSSRIAGASLLTNTAFEANVVNGDSNIAFQSLAGDIIMNVATDNAVLSKTTTKGLTNLSGAVDLSASTSVNIGAHLTGTTVNPGTSAVTAELKLGLPGAGTSGLGIHVQNTVPGVAFTGIEVGGNTTVEPSVRPSMLLWRGASGIGSAIEGGIAIASGSGFPFVGMVANDFGLFMEGGGDLYLGADNTTFVAAVKIKSSDNSVSILNGPLVVPTLDSMLVVRDAETNISLIGLNLIHDWDPFSGGAATPIVYATPDTADTVIDGIVKPSYAVCLGAIGLHRLPRLRLAQSATNHGKIILVNGEGSTSLAANQIWIQTNNAVGLSINHRGMVELEYDCLNGHWRMVGPTGSAWDGMLAFSDALTDVALAATVNDYSPALFGYVSMMRLGPAGGVSTITGMKALPDSGGRIQPIRCVTAFGTLVFSHNSASSLAGNRFYFPETRDLTLRAYQSACFRYDQGISFWTIWTAPPLAVAAYAGNTLVKWNNQDEVTTSSISDTGTAVSTSSSISANGGLTIAGQYTLLGRQTFKTSGTYTPSTGTRLVKLRECGGGGGSGGAKSNATGGGSSGAYLEITLNPGATITGGTVTIGAAGTAGAVTPTAGGIGGDTSVVIQAVTYTAKGGGASAANGMLGGAGQVGSTSADINQTGNPGTWGAVIAGTYISGNGGSSPFGSGGVGVQIVAGATAGNPGRDVCAGAGGSADFAGAGVAGAAGSAGFVILEEYK